MALARNDLAVSKRIGELAQMCLLCRACWNACPNKVDGPEFSLHLRDLVVREKGQTLGRKAIFRGVLPHRGLVRTVGRAGRVAQLLGLDKTAFGMLPGAPDDLAQYAPRLAKVPLTVLLKRREKARRRAAARAQALAGAQAATPSKAPGPRVAYFYGCLHNLAFPETGLATIDVLEHHGCQVVVPEQGCCGVPASANGDMKAARRMAAQNLASFARHQFDYIVTDCASCGSTLKEYGKLLDTDEAKAFSAKVMDIHKFLVSQGFFTAATIAASTPAPTPGTTSSTAPVAGSAQSHGTTVTYHDPCHLVRWQGVVAEPRTVLKNVPGVTLVEMKEADRCCGAAGSFSITHRELSRKIGARKAANIIASGAAAVATGCPSCRMQISYELERAGHPLPVVHPIELLAKAYREEEKESGPDASLGR